MAFLSRRLTDTESRYAARDRELLAVIYAFGQWRHYLLGRKFLLRTDHQSLQYLTTMQLSSRILKGRLARWMEEIGDFDFDIEYIRGATNIADALSRKTSHTTTKAISEDHANATTMVSDIEVDIPGTDIDSIRYDSYFGPILRVLQGNHHEESAVVNRRAARFSLDHDKKQHKPCALYLIDWDSTGKKELRRCVGGKQNQRSLIELYHESKAGGHQGPDKTYEALATTFFWPGMMNDIKKYCKTCHSCQTTKPDTRRKATIEPIEIPKAPGETICLDFLELPRPLEDTTMPWL